MRHGWRIADIVHHIQGTLVQGAVEGRVQGVSTDSRTVQAGELFVALPGERFDAHQFVPMALERGAAAVLVSHMADDWLSASRETSAVVIQVTDTQAALQDLALAHRRQFHGTVVAITGSSGKTTVKEMTAAILQTSFDTYKAPGNLNNHIGVPLALLGMALSSQVAVLEVGMNHLGEIHRLCEIALPHIGVITNIGQAHLGYLGSIEQIQQAKGELLEALDVSGVAIVNADDPRALALGHAATAQLLTFGQAPEAEVRGWVREDLGLEGVACTLALDGTTWDVHLPVPGVHQVLNALAAAAVGVVLQVPAACIVEALQHYHGMYGRMMIRRGRDGAVLIDDTYNANPQSMHVALQCLARAPDAGRHIAVLGDMLELGAAGPALHQELGAFVAQSDVDHLITFGSLAAHIAQGACRAGLPAAHVHTMTSQDEVLAVLTALVQPEDVILLKGSRGMAMEHVVHALMADEGSR